MPRGYSDWVEWESKELVQLINIFQTRGDRIKWKRIALKMRHRRVDELKVRFACLRKRFGPDTSKYPARFFEPYVRPRGRHMRAHCADKRMAAEQLKDPVIKAKLEARREKARVFIRERQRRIAAEARQRAAEEELDNVPLSRLVRRTRELAAAEKDYLEGLRRRDVKREERDRRAKLAEAQAAEENAADGEDVGFDEVEMQEAAVEVADVRSEDVGFEEVDQELSDEDVSFEGVDEGLSDE